VIRTFGSNYEFYEGLGLVVYNVVESRCYYYDIFSPDSPLNTSRAMSCQPGGADTLVMTLHAWHQKATKDKASYSWVDVGHRSAGGTLTNNLGEPGSYPPTLPVDEFMLLFQFPKQIIAKIGTGASETWFADQATGGSRTRFQQIEMNTTISVGATLGGVTTDAAGTFGFGTENSNTISWFDTIMFGGGYKGSDVDFPSYGVVPYVYQATAVTEAGTAYPYWELDYYVTK
jgi:hypothetical protein